MALLQDAERFKYRVSISWHDFADFHKLIINNNNNNNNRT